MRNSRPYSLASARFIHGGRTEDKSAFRQDRMKLLPMERTERGWAFWRK